ncbi:unnamed protein product [Cuscuta europaea]|uniref:Uncharacterized protein n=1 Tax=Cuscuta europaea TaxID=41803 RepID=A0A9P0YY80_CUSEU|nr:unnamed protein product [Cuscuta europaea]
MTGKVGKKAIITAHVDITNIELHRRKSIRSLAKAMGIPSTNVHRLIKKGLLEC